MDLFNALWDNGEQRKRPPDDDFKLFTMEEWLSMSSTHKILTGSLQCPLPPEIERDKALNDKIPLSGTNQLLESPKPQESSSIAGPSGVSSNAAMQLTNGKNGKNKKKSETYIPGLVKSPSLNVMSNLNFNEHEECLRLFLKFRGKSTENVTSSEQAEYQLFQSLYARVVQEQRKFLEFAKSAWPEYVNRASYLKGDPRNFFLQMWTDAVTRAFGYYSKKFKKIKDISLDHRGKTLVKMHLIKNALNIGKIPIIKLPEFDVPFRVASSIIRLRAWKSMNVPATQLNGTLFRIPVSKDPNAENLARLTGASVVISSSAFKCLLDNYEEAKHPHPSGVGKSWIIPVIVKEYRSFCNGKPVLKNVVFIDKVLPVSTMSSYQKVSWYHKQALPAAIVHRFHEGGIQFDIKGDDVLIRKVVPNENAENGRLADSDKRSHEEGHVEKSSKANAVSSVPDCSSLSTPKLDCSDIDDDDDDNSDDGRLKIEELGEETQKEADSCAPEALNNDSSEAANKAENPVEKAKKVESGSLTESKVTTLEKEFTEKEHAPVVLPKVLTAKDSSEFLNRWEKVPAPPPAKLVNGNALPPSYKNVTYNLWSLQSHPVTLNKDQSQLECDNNIDLLVRSCVDGCECLRSGKYQPICLAPKLEYQLEYGAGKVPLTELTRQWAKMLIQPDACLARVRVNAKTSELLKLEKRTLADIEDEAQEMYQVDLNDNLSTLYNVLSDLRNLSSGEYLLSRSSMGLTAELYLKANEGESVDWYLPGEYGAHPKEISSDIPWQPLDPTIVMPRHIFFNNMPCTFHPQGVPNIYHKISKPRQPKVPQKPQKPQKKKKKKSPRN